MSADLALLKKKLLFFQPLGFGDRGDERYVFRRKVYFIAEVCLKLSEHG